MNCTTLTFRQLYLVQFRTILSLRIFDLFKYEPRCEKNGLWGYPTRSDINRAAQPQEMANGLKFRI